MNTLVMGGLMKEWQYRGSQGEQRNQLAAEKEGEGEIGCHSALNQEEHRDWKVVREMNSIQLPHKICKVTEDLLRISQGDWLASRHCSS